MLRLSLMYLKELRSKTDIPSLPSYSHARLGLRGELQMTYVPSSYIMAKDSIP